MIARPFDLRVDVKEGECEMWNDDNLVAAAQVPRRIVANGRVAVAWIWTRATARVAMLEKLEAKVGDGRVAAWSRSSDVQDSILCSLVVPIFWLNVTPRLALVVFRLCHVNDSKR
jgi:hypothetical protein